VHGSAASTCPYRKFHPIGGGDGPGIRDHPASARSPWQNGYAERLIGSIRRECLDHIVVTGEQHLRHILACYMDYYNAVRTHLSLGKNAPNGRAIQRRGISKDSQCAVDFTIGMSGSRLR
jgi:Integrase core domain